MAETEETQDLLESCGLSEEQIRGYERATEDPRYFVTTYCFTAKLLDDAEGFAHAPTEILRFPDYRYLDPWWEAFSRRENVVWDKTRQMICSWAVMLSFLWALQFVQNWSALVVSRKGSLVDDGGKSSTHESLFGKVRYSWALLPQWIKAPLVIKPFMISNPVTGSFIKGETADPEAGRSGSFNAALMDEAGFLPWGEMIYASTSQAVKRGCVKLSTPNPAKPHNVHTRLRKAKPPGERMISTFWWDHPERRCTCTKPLDLDPAKHSGCWYARQCETLTDVQIAAELNGSYEAAVSGRTFSAFSRAIHQVDKLAIIDGPLIIRAWDFGVRGLTAIIIAQVLYVETVGGNRLPILRIFDTYASCDEPASHYRGILQAKARAYGRCKIIDIGDPHSLGTRVPVAEKITAKEKPRLASWKTLLANDDHEYKIHIKPADCRDERKEIVLENARSMLRQVQVKTDGEVQQIPRTVVLSSEVFFIESMLTSAYPTDEAGNVVGKNPHPIDDEYAHFVDAFSYLCWTASHPSDTGRRKLSKSDYAAVTRGTVFADIGGSVFQEGEL